MDNQQKSPITPSTGALTEPVFLCVCNILTSRIAKMCLSFIVGLTALVTGSYAADTEIYQATYNSTAAGRPKVLIAFGCPHSDGNVVAQPPRLGGCPLADAAANVFGHLELQSWPVWLYLEPPTLLAWACLYIAGVCWIAVVHIASLLTPVGCCWMSMPTFAFASSTHETGSADAVATFQTRQLVDFQLNESSCCLICLQVLVCVALQSWLGHWVYMKKTAWNRWHDHLGTNKSFSSNVVSRNEGRLFCARFSSCSCAVCIQAFQERSAVLSLLIVFLTGSGTVNACDCARVVCMEDLLVRLLVMFAFDNCSTKGGEFLLVNTRTIHGIICIGWWNLIGCNLWKLLQVQISKNICRISD